MWKIWRIVLEEARVLHVTGILILVNSFYYFLGGKLLLFKLESFQLTGYSWLIIMQKKKKKFYG